MGESSPPPAAVAAEGAGMEGAGGGVEAVVASLSAFLLFALLLATEAPSGTFSAAALPSAAPWAGSSLSMLWLRLVFLEEVFDLLPFFVLVPLSEGAGAGGGGGGGGRLSIQQGMR